MDITDRNTAAAAMRVLSILASNDWYTRDFGEVEALISPGHVLAWEWTRPPTPAYVVWTTGATLVFAITGMKEPSQGIVIFSGGIRPPVPVLNFGVNGGLWDALAPVLRVRAALGAELPGQIVCCGHSFGGGMATILAGVLTVTEPKSSVSLLTFGAPRAGDTALSRVLSGIPVRRIMNTGDTVPFVLPHLHEAPNANIAAGLQVAYNVGQYVQPRGGCILDRGGSLTPGELPSRVVPFADVTLLAWATQADRYRSVEHSWQTYDARMQADVVQFGPTVPKFTGSFKGELADPVTPAELEAAAAGVALLAEGSAVGTVTQVYIPPAYRPKAKRVGSTWSIIWMDRIVIQTPDRSRARTTAKYLFRFLRRMQQCRQLFSQDWNSSWAEYIQAAAASPAGFRPFLPVQ